MRFFLAQDNDGHWYLIPVDRRAEWEAWTNIPSDDERSWESPEWATAIGGSPSQVTFTDPQKRSTTGGER